jgi:hypothetical protein
MQRHAASSPHSPLRRRWLCLLLALLVAQPAGGQAVVAELSVTAFGRQRLELSSGRTVLEDGGEIVDLGSGVRLVADWISYAEGVDVVARGARLEGDLGLVVAPEALIDLERGRLAATGGVRWTRDGLAVAGRELRFDARAGVAWLVGDVVASSPAAAASEVWVDVASGRVLLLGPYRYAEGVLVLSGAEGSALQLDAVATEGGTLYDARTEVEPAWRASVEALRLAGWSTSAD